MRLRWRLLLGEKIDHCCQKLKAKILTPAITESEFAQKSIDTEAFDFEANMPKYHTAKQMAGFMVNLYDSNEVVRIVDRNYTFNLKRKN
ncbi:MULTISPECIES: hypothetical protein [unclassified Paenibacillus]|jgi:hypothetical protein|uniref:hypothetical protein n=1 Tax=unclassified Paenibacillus TaxID=185978 RepID=UPI001787BA2F|nr:MULTISPECIES: hypothetical protein [unclassified Paenibacillus]MBP1176439.1 hypothetical protein [Paenibacillus sp. PvR133]QYK67457.1 hypothetical protein KAI36_02607 [Paenibacillus sp. S02]